MEINIEQGKLSKALTIVSRVATGSKTTLPILNNVLIKVEEGKARLVTTNLDMAVVDYLPTSKAKDGVITVPAKLLADFVSNLPKGEVKIETSDEKVIITSGKYRSAINGSMSDEFPELPEIDENKAVIYRLPTEVFKEGISQVKVAASNDTTRPALTGVFFNTYEGVLYAASTDGYRMTEKRLVSKVSSEVKAIVPASSLNEVMNSISDDIDEVEILFDESQVKFRFGEIEITSKLIDGSFPDYKQLIPEKTASEVVISKDELIRVTKLASLFAREVGGSIICEADKTNQVFKVSSVANEYGENTSEIEAEISEDGKVTLNSRYLLDALNLFDDKKIRFGISKDMLPTLLSGEKTNDYLHIIMPLRG